MQRSAEIAAFVTQACGMASAVPTLLAGDASARRYWRVAVGAQRYIVLDQAEDSAAVAAFAEITRQLRTAAGCDFVPTVYAQADGLLLLSDFGDQWLFHALRRERHYLHAALALLALWQQRTQIFVAQLTHYDVPFLCREMDLLPQWFLPYVGVDADVDALRGEMARLAHAVAQHPQRCVHRDFHSRNIMLRDDGSLGLLDYQDWVLGSAAYDLVSLTRDCYIRHDAETVTALEWQFGQQHVGMDSRVYWQRCCDEVALQRHLKVLGIFVRLAQRDGKAGYLPDLPRVLAYARQEALALADYPHIAALLAASQAALAVK